MATLFTYFLGYTQTWQISFLLDVFLICISHFYHIQLHTQKKQIFYVVNRDENWRAFYINTL